MKHNPAPLETRLEYIRTREMPPRTQGPYLRATEGHSPKTAIEVVCQECQGWDYNAAENCDCEGCPLWCYRPKGSGKGKQEIVTPSANEGLFSALLE